MSYQQARIPVSEQFAEALSDALMDEGALSVAIEDAHAGTDSEEEIFGEPDMPQQKLWQQSVLLALFDANSDVQHIIHQTAQALNTPIGEVVVDEVAEQDWVRLTQSQFDPIQISERLWITPTWHEMPDQSAINLRLDPGLAFGTGSHPTTHLCLQWLDKNIQQNSSLSVLDYGCGSGILAIAALKLGAAQAVGVDIDPQAIQASQDNTKQNQVDAIFYLPHELPEQQTFDVVVANILANPLRLLGEMLASRTKVGGRIVLSGILAEQIGEMSELYSQWFELVPTVTLDGWACISGTKRA